MATKFDKLLILLLLSLVVILSGCINQAPSIPIGVNGMVIRDIYVEPPADQIQTTDPYISITANVENVGGSTARNVVAELLGTGGWLPSTPLPNVIIRNWYDVDEDPTDNQLGVAAGKTFSPPTPESIGTISPVRFLVPTPLTVPEGQSQSFPLWIHVEYDYTTSATVLIPGYSRDGFRIEKEQKKISDPIKTTLPVQQTQNTPITVSITGPDKIIVDGPYDEEFYQLTFTNIGTFVPLTRDPRTGQIVDGLIFHEIWIDGPGVFAKDCLGAGSDPYRRFYSQADLTRRYSEIVAAYADEDWFLGMRWVQGTLQNLGISAKGKGWWFSLSYDTQQLFLNQFAQNPPVMWRYFPELVQAVKLRRGESAGPFTCIIGIKNTPDGWNNRMKDTIAINIHLRYRYYIEEPLSITVTAPLTRVPPAGV